MVPGREWIGFAITWLNVVIRETGVAEHHMDAILELAIAWFLVGMWVGRRGARHVLGPAGASGRQHLIGVLRRSGEPATSRVRWTPTGTSLTPTSGSTRHSPSWPRNGGGGPRLTG